MFTRFLRLTSRLTLRQPFLYRCSAPSPPPSHPPPSSSRGMSSTTAAGSTSGSGRQLVVDPFCFRAFDDEAYSGYLGGALSKGDFEARLNDMFEAQERPLVDGYAPFCKHFFVRNFVGNHLKTPVVKITPENERLLRSGYEARTPEELPVLQRWFDAKDVTTPTAEWLDIILYSGDQIVKENAAMGKERTQTEPWGIVSIKPQNASTELPMQPITMLRNALGKEQGGSGVALTRDAYDESVKFWKGHAPVRASSSK
jgi:hypothetical protein